MTRSEYFRTEFEALKRARRPFGKKLAIARTCAGGLSGIGTKRRGQTPEARPTRMLPLPGLRLPDDLASNGGRYRRAPARYVGLIRPGLVQCGVTARAHTAFPELRVDRPYDDRPSGTI
jgi:hypothetical protein